MSERAVKTSLLFKKLTDKSIIEGVRLQDEKVLSYIYDHYFKTVQNHVLNNSGSADDASDVFQDSIIKLYELISINNFKPDTELKGYFFGIARNLWTEQLKLRKRISTLNDDVVDEDGDDDLFDPALEKILNRSFQRLKPDCQKILTLYYSDKSYEKIAQKLKLKDENYAKRKKYLCKEALLEIIKNDPDFKDCQRFLK